MIVRLAVISCNLNFIKSYTDATLQYYFTVAFFEMVEYIVNNVSEYNFITTG